MKRLLNVMLVVVLVLSIAACSSGNNDTGGGNTPASGEQPSADQQLTPEEGAELLVWESEGLEGEWLQYVGEQFEKEYGIPVKYEAVTHADAPGKLQTDGPAGLGADVFAAPHDHLGSMISSGLILENSFPEEYNNEFLRASIDGTTYDGTLYGFPTAIETYALFYNKDLVKKVPETFDEMIEQAKALTNVQENKYGFMMEAANFYYIYSFMGGYGGYVFGENNTNPEEIGLNSEGAVKGAKLLQRLHNEVLPLKIEDITYDVKNSLFDEGKLAFDINGPWAVAGHRDAGVNFGVAPLPKLDNGKSPTSFSGIRALYINSYTKYPVASTLFAQFATSEEMLLKRFEITGQIPPRTSLLENETIKNDEISAAFLEQAQHAVPMPNIPEMVGVWEPMAAALTTIWNDNADPQQALDNAVTQLKETIQQK